MSERNPTSDAPIARVICGEVEILRAVRDDPDQPPRLVSYGMSKEAARAENEEFDRRFRGGPDPDGKHFWRFGLKATLQPQQWKLLGAMWNAPDRTIDVTEGFLGIEFEPLKSLGSKTARDHPELKIDIHSHVEPSVYPPVYTLTLELL